MRFWPSSRLRGNKVARERLPWQESQWLRSLAALGTRSVEDITIPDAPESDADPFRFFVHPPTDLEDMRAAVEKSNGC